MRGVLLWLIGIPIPVIIFNKIAFPLQLFASSCAVGSMRVFNIPVLRQGNVIELRMTADETAKKIKGAKTDSERLITYDPANRPEVANLLKVASLCEGVDPEQIATEIGDGGGGGLKARVTDAVNTFFAPLRERRLELEADPGFVDKVLERGNRRANELADATLLEVREKMGMTYP